MTAAKHTPGPWETAATDDNLIVKGRVKIASTYPEKFSADEEGANARLIAAAPELLEALYTFLEVGDCAAAREEAHAAIAKAEGRS